jgi:L-methionine (R)-S-oxide reductase
MAEELIINHQLSKAEKYEQLLPQLEALVADETNIIANLSNCIAALNEAFNFLWVGVYFVDNNNPTELVLGPFQGPIACTRIKKGKGVCGTAWETEATIIVPDVDLFPGHIACSSASKSEIVVPVMNDKNNIIMVIDVDSAEYNTFDTTDKFYLEKIAILIAHCVKKSST